MNCKSCGHKLSPSEESEVREFQTDPICWECFEMMEDSQNPQIDEFSDADPGL